MKTIMSEARSQSSLQWLLMIAGVIGIPAIFLQFTMDTSPWRASVDVDYGLWKIALPTFFPIPVVIGLLRLLITKKLSLPERLVAYFMSMMSVVVTLTIYTKDNGWPAGTNDWFGFVLPLITIGLGVFILVSTRRDAMLQPYRAIMSMQIAYVANALLCLGAFFGQWQIGAYFSLVTVIVYLTQIIMVLRNNSDNSDL